MMTIATSGPKGTTMAVVQGDQNKNSISGYKSGTTTLVLLFHLFFASFLMSLTNLYLFKHLGSVQVCQQQHSNVRNIVGQQCQYGMARDWPR